MARTMSVDEELVLYWLGEEYGGPVTQSDRHEFNGAVRGVLSELAAERAAHEATKAEAQGWRNGQAQVQHTFDLLFADHMALKAQLAEFCATIEVCPYCNSSAVAWTSNALKARLALADTTIEMLNGRADHGPECLLSRWEAGRPTPTGGYEWKYAGKWYADGTLPPCACGLDAAIDKWRAAK